jgi:hypothetical protein
MIPGDGNVPWLGERVHNESFNNPRARYIARTLVRCEAG